jgi:hypothetical protein
MHGERLLSTISVSEAVIPLSATSCRPAASRPIRPFGTAARYSRSRHSFMIAHSPVVAFWT